MCHADEEQASPSRSTLIEFVLPLKIHFRYCWLFSGVPLRNTARLGDRAQPLTEKELVGANRALMASGDPELCSRVSRDDVSYQEQAIKAFWLTAEGRLVYVDRVSEDVKFRYLRQYNTSRALSLWTADPELCGQTMRASGAAHENLINICGEAARLSRGKFYNLYANYPLPFQEDEEQRVPLEVRRSRDGHIRATEVRNGEQLLLELQPLYTEYFSFISDNSRFERVADRVSLLGARWLVRHDCSELQFSLDLRRSWFMRTAIRLALFLAVS